MTDRPLLPVSLVLMLSSLALAGCTSLVPTDPSASWELPTMRAGTVVEYARGSETLVFEVRDGEPALAGDGSVVDGYEFTAGRWFWHTDERYLPISAGSTCLIAKIDDVGGKECTLWEDNVWGDVQGPFWGASFLQGRALRIGDAWNITSCCGGMRSVEIREPSELSPPGTTFVAGVEITGSPFVTVGVHGPAILHMSHESAYPLRVESRNGMGDPAEPWIMVALRESQALSPPRSGIDETRPLAPAAWRDGLPPDGNPPPGIPSIHVARTGAGEVDPVGALAYLGYSVETVQNRIAPQLPPYNETDFTFTIEDGDAQAGSYRLAMHRIAGPTNVDSPWSSTPHVPGATEPLACPPETIPVWDVVRLAEGARVMHHAIRYAVLPPCTLRVWGTAPDMSVAADGAVGFGHPELFDFDLALGRFTSANVYRDSE